MKITIYDDEAKDILRALDTQYVSDIQDITIPRDDKTLIEWYQSEHKAEEKLLDRYTHLCKVIKGEGTRRPAVKEPELLPTE